jgi:type VI secretion system Hcp family effector
MAFDAFIKISSIKGESQDFHHPGWIEVVKYGFAVGQQISRTTGSCGGATAQRSDFSEFVFKKELDVSSPLLSLACAEGRHVDKVILDVCGASGEEMSFMQYELRNCLISHVSTLHKHYFAMEIVRIDFGKIYWIYTRQNRTGGSAMGRIACGWNRETNSKM